LRPLGHGLVAAQPFALWGRLEAELAGEHEAALHSSAVQATLQLAT